MASRAAHVLLLAGLAACNREPARQEEAKASAGLAKVVAPPADPALKRDRDEYVEDIMVFTHMDADEDTKRQVVRLQTELPE